MAVTGLVPIVVTAKLADSHNFSVLRVGCSDVSEGHRCDQLHGARAGGLPAAELAFMLPDGEDQPAPVHAVHTGSGVIQTVEADDGGVLDARFSDAGARRDRIVPLRDGPWGPRNFRFFDPAGALANVGQQIPSAPEHVAAYSADEEPKQ